MDWLDLIKQFKPIKSTDTSQFAPARDKDRAVAAYNRALTQIEQDSMDIALIELKKLSATYPRFYQASLLLSYCQAYQGHYDSAGSMIRTALGIGLPGELEFQALEAQRKIDRMIARQKQADNAGIVRMRPKTAVRRFFSKRSGSSPAGSILQKTGRHSAMRMASDKERQTVTRQTAASGQDQNAKAARRRPQRLRTSLIAATSLVLAGLLIWAGAALLPGIIERGRENREAQSRLDWLISRLEQLSSQNPAIMDILDDYRIAFETTPTTAPAESSTIPASSSDAPSATEQGQTTASSGETTSNVTGQTTTSPSAETATPAAATANQAETDLVQAVRLYRQASDLNGSDLVKAADNLLSARHLLAGVPSGTTSADVSGTAADLSAAVDDMISGIARSAAGEFWNLGRAKFDEGKYQDALVPFLKMIELDPGYYRGGGAYYCGRCYQLLGENESAKPYYEYVILNNEGRDIAVYAAERLKQMGY